MRWLAISIRSVWRTMSTSARRETTVKSVHPRAQRNRQND
jgi:hypothetical protein